MRRAIHEARYVQRPVARLWRGPIGHQPYDHPYSTNGLLLLILAMLDYGTMMLTILAGSDDKNLRERILRRE